MRECADEEIGVVTTGALFFRRDPVRPRPEQIRTQRESLATQEVPEGQAAVLQEQRAGRGTPRRRARCRQGRRRFRRTAPRTPRRSPRLRHARAPRPGRTRFRLCPPGGFGPEPGVVGHQARLAVPVVDAAAGNTVMPAANSMAAWRRMGKTSRLSTWVSRTSITVAAGRTASGSGSVICASGVRPRFGRGGRRNGRRWCPAMDCRNASDRVSAVSTSASRPAAATCPSDKTRQWLNPGGISST